MRSSQNYFLIRLVHFQLKRIPMTTAFIPKNILFLLLSFFVTTTIQADNIRSINLSFYSEVIDVDYHINMLIESKVRAEERSMVQYFRNMESTDYQLLLNNLQAVQDEFQLNDWLTYELMTKAVDKIYTNHSSLQKTLTCWFLLSKAGFDTRLTYLNQKAFLYVHTKDELFEVPMIEEKGEIFVNLSSIHKQKKQQAALYMLNFIANESGRPFSFSLTKLPQLTAKINTTNLEFINGDIRHNLQVKTDETIAELMHAYPFFAEEKYLEVPLSPTVAQSLLPQLRHKIKGLSNYKAVQLIAAFTRSGFKYREDKQHFGKSKPMIADELFHYDYSDCEDRSALFYTLVRALLDLPMIVVAYSDHLTVAVHLPEMSGNAITYQGKKYYICDPTGPSNSNEIGFAPKGYEREKFEIIGNYMGVSTLTLGRK